jgi:hypothetical protein
MKLMDYVMQLPERVLQTLDDAKTIPADKQAVDEVDARVGDGAVAMDVNAYVNDRMAESSPRSEYESLMRAVAILHVRLAFIEVETPEGKRFVRIDKMQ